MKNNNWIKYLAVATVAAGAAFTVSQWGPWSKSGGTANVALDESIALSNDPGDALIQRTAVISIPEILKKSTASQQANQKFHQDIQEFQKKIRAEEDALREKGKKLSEQRKKMTEAELKQKAEEYQREVEAIQSKIMKEKKKSESAQVKVMQKIQDEVIELTKDIMQDRNIRYVFNKEATFLFQNGVDITDDVVARLNEELKEIDIKALEEEVSQESKKQESDKSDKAAKGTTENTSKKDSPEAQPNTEKTNKTEQTTEPKK